MILDQTIARLEYIHSKHLLHRDIKPENFLLGLNKKSNKIFAIDFGLAKRFEDPKTLDHIPYREGKSLVGTARYASLNTHLGIEQSRRDDLEACAYMILYFLKGNLPWQGLRVIDKNEKYQKIVERKINVSVNVLCAGLPDEFSIFFNYSRALRFEEKPDYSFIRGLFRDLFIKQNFQFDYMYD